MSSVSSLGSSVDVGCAASGSELPCAEPEALLYVRPTAGLDMLSSPHAPWRCSGHGAIGNWTKPATEGP